MDLVAAVSLVTTSYSRCWDPIAAPLICLNVILFSFKNFSHFFLIQCSFQEPLNEEEEEEEPNPPVLVPLADLLNHVANHNANLEYSPVSKTLTAILLSLRLHCPETCISKKALKSNPGQGYLFVPCPGCPVLGQWSKHSSALSRSENDFC